MWHRPGACLPWICVAAKVSGIGTQVELHLSISNSVNEMDLEFAIFAVVLCVCLSFFNWWLLDYPPLSVFPWCDGRTRANTIVGPSNPGAMQSDSLNRQMGVTGSSS